MYGRVPSFCNDILRSQQRRCGKVLQQFGSTGRENCTSVPDTRRDLAMQRRETSPNAGSAGAISEHGLRICRNMLKCADDCRTRRRM